MATFTADPYATTQQDMELWEAEKRHEHRKKACIKLAKNILSHVGLLIAVVAYTGGGGAIFEHLEKTNEISECIKGQSKYANLLNASVDLIWDDSNRNDMSDDDKRDSFRLKLDMFRQSVRNSTFDYDLTTDCKNMYHKWEFVPSLLFAATVITTIGYGFIAPVTFWGRLVCIAYAMMGIPLMLMFLANIGDGLATVFRFVYSRVCCCGCCKRKDRTQVQTIDQMQKPELAWNTDASGRPIGNGPTIIEDDEDEQQEEDEDAETTTVPLTVTLTVMSSYILLGAALFSATEGWTLADAAYFSFVTVATIGFGDLVPGINNLSDPTTPLRFVATGFYMVIGMAFLSMCFALMQEEIIDKFQWLGRKLGIVKKEDDMDEDEEETTPLPPMLPVVSNAAAANSVASNYPNTGGYTNGAYSDLHSQLLKPSAGAPF